MESFDATRAVQRLTGNLALRTFNDDIRERRAWHVEAAFGSADVGELFGLGRLDRLVAEGTVPTTSIDVFEDGHLMRLADLQKKSGRTGSQIVAERARAGATIRLRDVDHADPRLGAFVEAVRRRFGASSQINVYLTPPGRDGFPPHFDITDVFVVQCLGSKVWRIFADYTSRIDLPAAATDWEPDRYRPLGTPDEIDLHPGDVLYLPRGVMHQAACRDRASLHLTISLAPLTFADLIASEVHRIAASQVELRRRVPWSLDDEPPVDVPHVTERTRACLALVAEHLDVVAAIEAVRPDRPADRRTGAAGGSLERAISPLFEPAAPEAARDGTIRDDA